VSSIHVTYDFHFHGRSIWCLHIPDRVLLMLHCIRYFLLCDAIEDIGEKSFRNQPAFAFCIR